MTQMLPGTKLRVALATGHEAVAHLSGKRRKHVIWISIRNHVQVAMLFRDLCKGQITFREQVPRPLLESEPPGARSSPPR